MSKGSRVRQRAGVSLPPEIPSLNRASELRSLYEVLQEKLKTAKGSGAAALGLQLRILARELDQIQEVEVTRVDELAARRKTEAGPARPPARRRKSR